MKEGIIAAFAIMVSIIVAIVLVMGSCTSRVTHTKNTHILKSIIGLIFGFNHE